MAHNLRSAILVVVTLVPTLFGCRAKINQRTNLPSIPMATSIKSQPTATPGFVSVRTDQSRYDDVGVVKLVVSNTTSQGIRIPTPQSAGYGEGTFRFYKKTVTGWERLRPASYGWLAGSLAGPSGWLVAAGSELEVNVGSTMFLYTRQESPHPRGEYIVQIRYQPDGSATSSEWVQYSNEFLIDEAEPISDQSATVRLSPTPSQTLELTNSSILPLWFPSPCSSIPVWSQDKAFADDGFLSLQWQTPDKIWQIIRAEVSCDETTEPVRIEPGQVTIIHVGPWFQKELNIPGVYRWDVVFYRTRYWGTNPYLDDARHILSDVFATDK